MTRNRSYHFNCPIARALDRIGDRWTLLILRDLYAGPARFLELQRGLTGIATNLLTDRLTKLMADELVELRQGSHGLKVHDLTDRIVDLGEELLEMSGREIVKINVDLIKRKRTSLRKRFLGLIGGSLAFGAYIKL